MPRKSKRRTRRKRGGDKECNQIAKTICGDVKNFEKDFDMTGAEGPAVYATRSVNEHFDCKKALDENGKVIMIKDEYDRAWPRDSPNFDPNNPDKVREEAKYVDPLGKTCFMKTYSSRVPKRNIEDCKHSKLGSSKVFKECHGAKKQGFFHGVSSYLNERDIRSSNNMFGRSDGGLVGGRWLFSHKSRKKKRKRTKKKRRRKKKKTRKRRRKRRR